MATFPLYATGNGTTNVLDYAISSYSATITAVQRSHERRTANSQLTNPPVLAICRDQIPEQRDFPSAKDECDNVKKLFVDDSLVTKRPTEDQLLSVLNDRNRSFNVLHYDGHGMYGGAWDPAESRLCLTNSEINVVDVVPLMFKPVKSPI